MCVRLHHHPSLSLSLLYAGRRRRRRRQELIATEVSEIQPHPFVQDSLYDPLPPHPVINHPRVVCGIKA